MTLPVAVTLTVTGARVAIDTPAEGATVNNGFTVAGWAVDVAAPSGTGVSEVDVYAYPASGPPIFLGVATLRRRSAGCRRRSTESRFTNSGYSLTVNNLTPGATYQISVFAKSTVIEHVRQFDVGERHRMRAPARTREPPPPDPNPVPPPKPTAPGRRLARRQGPEPGCRSTGRRSASARLAGTNATRTGAQSVTVDFATGTPAWTASTDVTWLDVTPASGVGTGQVQPSRSSRGRTRPAPT